MSFADLEERTNAAVMQRLANARALKVGEADDFAVIFDRGAVETSAGVTATMPMFDALSSDVAGFVPHSTEVEISDVTYKVIDVQPDGTGMSKVFLEVA
jgi:hypothetical protein